MRPPGETRSPGAAGTATGAVGMVFEGTNNRNQDTLPGYRAQALADRFGLPIATARVVAELAFTAPGSTAGRLA